MWPTSQVYGRTFTGVSSKRRTLALTYDDGPNDPYTLRLLDLLASHNVKATFFMRGRAVEQLSEVARAVAAAGHAIGNHTYSHPNLIFATPAQVRHEIARCAAVLNNTVGEHTTLFRPPFGARRPDVLATVRRMGMVPVMWRVSAEDWKGHSAALIVSRLQERIRGGEVLLMHDGGHQRLGVDRSETVAATDMLIRHYKDRGFTFETVPEMMAHAD